MITTEILSSLFSIIAIDLVLAGDNAVVIALACCKLPDQQRLRAIYLGTFGAIAIRTLMTIVAVWLLTIPLLQAIGGLLLIPVAVKLLGQDAQAETIDASCSFWGAIKTIIIADAIMGIDNVVAIAGASHGNIGLVVLGLLVSVPLVIWGSRWISVWMQKYPALIYLGTAILAWTAGTMILADRLVGAYLLARIPMANWLLPVMIIIAVVTIGSRRRNADNEAENGRDREDTQK